VIQSENTQNRQINEDLLEIDLKVQKERSSSQKNFWQTLAYMQRASLQ